MRTAFGERTEPLMGRDHRELIVKYREWPTMQLPRAFDF